MYFKDNNPDTVDFLCDVYRKDLSIKGGCLTHECAKLCYGAVPSFLKPARRRTLCVFRICGDQRDFDCDEIIACEF